jgi:hypothetical protein
MKVKLLKDVEITMLNIDDDENVTQIIPKSSEIEVSKIDDDLFRDYIGKYVIDESLGFDNQQHIIEDIGCFILDSNDFEIL